MTRDSLDEFDRVAINTMVHTIGRFNKTQGWRNKSDDIIKVLTDAGRDDLVPIFTNYLAGTMIALLHSELSEALEGLRKNLMDDKLPHRKMVEVELADVLIRLLDFSDVFGLDLGGATVEKDAYNHIRSDHKLTERSKPHGKAF